MAYCKTTNATPDPSEVVVVMSLLDNFVFCGGSPDLISRHCEIMTRNHRQSVCVEGGRYGKLCNPHLCATGREQCGMTTAAGSVVTWATGSLCMYTLDIKACCLTCHSMYMTGQACTSRPAVVITLLARERTQAHTFRFKRVFKITLHILFN